MGLLIGPYSLNMALPESLVEPESSPRLRTTNSPLHETMGCAHARELFR